ncbi:hypothetical protein HanPI659440_Chr13g0481701 [Helianthus annuus]|nr:hypothetical protein HanPI659440_Chr13g0481701 [Helianthus annuus]
MSNNTRFPVSVKFIPTTAFPDVLVLQTVLPLISSRTKSPVTVKFSIAPILTRESRFADQTT